MFETVPEIRAAVTQHIRDGKLNSVLTMNALG